MNSSDDAVAAVLELTDGVGVDRALECVGTDQRSSAWDGRRPVTDGSLKPTGPCRRPTPATGEVVPTLSLSSAA